MLVANGYVGFSSNILKFPLQNKIFKLEKGKKIEHPDVILHPWEDRWRRESSSDKCDTQRWNGDCEWC